MPERNTVTLSDSDRGLRAAVGLLHAGELVAFPTETVYGLGADARNAAAVAGIFAAKGRPAFNPLIVHVADRAAAERLADFTADARALADRFWPGPLTLVLPRRDDAGLAAAATAGLPTVALRVPAHPLARRLLDAFAGPLAAPSANPSGAVSPTTAAHVRDGLAGRIAAVLDGGACPVGLESTIIGFEGATPVLLRPGGLPAEAIAAALGRELAAPAAAGITAPGQLASHYAPRARPAPRRRRSRPRRGPPRLRPRRRRRPQPLALRRPRRGRRQPLRPPARRRRARRRPRRRRASPSPRSRAPASAPRSTTASPAPPPRATRRVDDGCDLCVADLAQARPPSADSSRGSIEIDRSAAPHFSASLNPNSSSASAGAVSQPFAWISDSSCPGPQPA